MNWTMTKVVKRRMVSIELVVWEGQNPSWLGRGGVDVFFFELPAHKKTTQRLIINYKNPAYSLGLSHSLL